MKKLFAILAVIIIAFTVLVCFTACDTQVTRGVVIARGERMDVDRFSSDDGIVTMAPLHEGYFIQVAECDENGNYIYRDSDGNIVTDGTGTVTTCWYYTSLSNWWEYNELQIGSIFEYESGSVWSKDL